MKTIEEMAHDYLCAEIAHSGMNMINEHDAVRMAFLFAKAMQAEAEKRKTTPNADPMCKVREAEWQPDWSQAPDAKYWAMDKDYTANFFKSKPEITNGNGWDFGNVMYSDNNHSYQGDWKDSLRKRP